MNHAARVSRLQSRLTEQGVDALLVTSLVNVRYLTGFSGTAGAVLITAGDAFFFSDPRYAARAGTLVQEAKVVIYPTRLTDVLTDHLGGIGRLGIEAASMTIAAREDLQEALGIELVPTKDVVEDLRRTKEPDEIETIRRAVALADEAFGWALDRIEPGRVERDLALDIEMWMRRAGADDVSFEPIVGSGPLTAHIHHTPGDRTFEKGDLVLMDIGCKLEGYCSDLTRTVAIGPPTDEHLALYDTVLSANLAGNEAARPGTPCKDVDAAARSIIEAAGHGDDFGHGLGHGVGLDIHEAPRLNRTSDQELRAGDVVTIEPGIYVVGSGGIRIEDCVLVTADGPEVLSAAPKDALIEL